MKQSAKTLGVAVLGAAFAAAAAGSASAAPMTHDAAGALDAVQALPVADGLTELPAGAADSLTAGEGAVGQAAENLPAASDSATQQVTQTAPNALAESPVGGLLGGLPVNGLATNSALPTGPLGGLPLGGLPLGGLPIG
ncbi:hypothetical protein ABZO31_20730 [Streptomyces sp. HUAS MG47]|uniref:hypothetical protein n=1 Tax=Streptomyces solicamelliae TaxID=3231716 RepID=UPI0038779251